MYNIHFILYSCLYYIVCICQYGVVCVCVCVCVCLCICIYIYIYTNIGHSLVAKLVKHPPAM